MSRLKKAGILTDTTDIRRAEPSWVRSAGPRGGRYTLSELISKYDAIVSNKATVVPASKLSQVDRKFWDKLGAEKTRGGGLAIPHAATQAVKIEDGHVVRYSANKSIRAVQLPVEYHNLEQYLRDNRKDVKKIQRMKKKGEYFAFYYFGGHSKIYQSADHLLEELQHYGSVLEAINKHDSRSMNEIYQNLQIVSTTKPAWYGAKEAARVAAKVGRSHHRKGERKAKLRKLKSGAAWKLKDYRKERAEDARKARAAMTPAEKEEYKRKARERAKRSRQK